MDWAVPCAAAHARRDERRVGCVGCVGYAWGYVVPGWKIIDRRATNTAIERSTHESPRLESTFRWESSCITVIM
jgi:hypothetical protein